MERRQHEMARQRGLDGDLSGFEVADLSDEHDVGVLAQERTQRGGEVEADGLADLDLVDPRHVELDGILRGHDVGVRFVQCGDRGVESVGLAGASGAGN